MHVESYVRKRDCIIFKFTTVDGRLKRETDAMQEEKDVVDVDATFGSHASETCLAFETSLSFPPRLPLYLSTSTTLYHYSTACSGRCRELLASLAMRFNTL